MLCFGASRAARAATLGVGPEGEYAAPRAAFAAIDQLVSECEAVISVENQGWMAQWEKPTG